MIAKYSQGNKPVYDITHWVVETTEDVAEIKYCAMGSTAYVITTGNKYMVDSTGTWYPMPKAGECCGDPIVSSEAVVWGEIE